jgi:hypothetical protein
MEEEARETRERAAAERAKQEAEAKRLQDVEQSRTRTQSAYNNALEYGKSKLSGKGINDSFGIMDLYRAELDRARGMVPEVTDNPGSFFSNDLYDTAYDTARNKYRSTIDSEFDSTFGDTYAQDYFADTMDDSIIDSVLGRQRTDAMAALDASLARGKINQFGYDQALADLEDMGKVGRSKANDLGMGVISKYRTNLGDRVGKYDRQIDTIDFTDNWNFDNAKKDITGFGDSMKGSLEGDILSAIGDTSFFDTSKLIAKAGERGGVFNPISKPSTSNSLGNALMDDEQKKKSGNTLTSAGAF